LSAGASFEISDEAACDPISPHASAARVTAHESSPTITPVASPVASPDCRRFGRERASGALGTFRERPPAHPVSQTHHHRVARVFSVQSSRPRLTCPEPCPELGNSETNSENSNDLRCPYKTANRLQTATL
jgi:hypothetical protein